MAMFLLKIKAIIAIV